MHTGVGVLVVHATQVNRSVMALRTASKLNGSRLLIADTPGRRKGPQLSQRYDDDEYFTRILVTVHVGCIMITFITDDLVQREHSQNSGKRGQGGCFQQKPAILRKRDKIGPRLL